MPAPSADGRAARRIGAAGAALFALAAMVAAPAAAADVRPASTLTETAAPVQFAIIVPIIAPHGAAGLLSTDELAELTDEDGDLTVLLDEVGTRRVTFAVDPLIAASIHALGAQAPDSAVAWIDRLDKAPQDRFPLLTADADPTLLRQSGAALPVLGTVWTTPGTVSVDDVTAFSARGALRVLVGDADLAERPDPTTALASVEGVGIAVVDGAATTALEAAVANPSAVTLGELRETIGDERISVVAGVGRHGANWDGLGEVLEALNADLGVALVGLDTLSGATAEAVLVSGAQPEPRLEAARRLVAAQEADATFASITADPAAVRGDRQLRTYRLTAVGWQRDVGWQNAVDSALEESQAFRGGVRIVEADSLLLADRSSLPVSVVNDLDQAVTVVVSVRAATGRLDIDDAPVTVTVPAATRSSISFDYTAVSNGNVAVTARLTSVDGLPIGQPAVANVNVQAGWETPIAAAAAGLLGIIVVIGIVRTVRRTRRAGEDSDE